MCGLHNETPLEKKRQEEPSDVKKRSEHPGGLQLEEKQEIYPDQVMIVSDIFPVNILYGGLLVYRKPDRISVVILTGPTTSALFNRPSSYDSQNGSMYKQRFSAEKKPPALPCQRND